LAPTAAADIAATTSLIKKVSFLVFRTKNGRINREKLFGG